MQRSVPAILILLFLATTDVTALARDATETAGDVLQVLIPAAAYASTLYLGDDDGQNQFYRVFAANLSVTYLLKMAVEKERPDGSDRNSFPSAHTSVAFNGAAFLCRRYGWAYGLPAYLAAAFVGYSRVDSRAHYAEDVVAGAAVGILCAQLLATPLERAAIVPLIGAETYGAAVVVTW